MSKLKLVGLLLFFISGFTSLVYQMIWIRQLSLAVGSTSASMSLVLSIFFFGLAAGSFLLGKFHHKIANPIWTYGKIEGFIGVYGAGLVYLLFNMQQIMVWIYPSGELSLVSHLIKFSIVFLVLILPTLAMGATLPILVKAFESLATNRKTDLSNSNNSSSSVSLLYGVNTLGAVFGAFLSGFFLIPSFGVEITNHVAVFGNLLLLGIAYAYRSQFGSNSARAQEKMADTLGVDNNEEISAKSEVAPNHPSKRKSFSYVFMSGAAGFATLTAEVVWSKYLGIFMGTNIYGLSIILSLFLLGIALGSLLLNKILFKIKDRQRFFYLLCIALFVLLWVATALLAVLPVGTTLLSYYIGGAVSLLTIKFLVAGLFIVGPTLVSGMLLPLAIELISRQNHDTPRATGQIYSVNTIGSIAGSYLSGVLLIPLIGSSHTLTVGLIVMLAAIIVVGFSHRFLTSRSVKAWAILLIIALAVFTQGDLHYKNIIRSAYRQKMDGSKSLTELLQIYNRDNEQFVKIIEGQTAIISLSHDQSDGPNYRDFFRLKTNGLNESIYYRTSKDTLPKYEALLGLLPYVFLEDPQNAFIVGYGGGYSVDFLSSTDLKHVFVAELEKGILEAADYVYNGNNPIIARPNVDLRIEDARFLLAVGTEAPFDIIASQPSHSWLSGVANLFTLEYFELVKSRLKPKGIFSQWLNLYNMDVDVLKSILKTFYSVFPHGAVFTNLQDDELILLGSQSPLQYDLQRADQVMHSPKLVKRLQSIPLNNAYELLAHMTVTRSEVLSFAEGAPINTDRNAYAETRQSKLFYGDRHQNVQSFLDSEFRGAYNKLVPDSSRAESSFWFKTLDALNASGNFYKYNRVLGLKKEALSENPEDKMALARAYYQMERYASATEILTPILKNKVDAETLNLALNLFLATNNFTEANELLSRQLQYGDNVSRCLALEVYSSSDKLADAKPLATAIEKDLPEYLRDCGENVKFYLGHYYNEIARHGQAIAYLNAYYKLVPTYLPAMKYLIGSLIATDSDQSAYAFMAEAAEQRLKDRSRIEILRDYYVSINAVEDAAILTEKIDRLN